MSMFGLVSDIANFVKVHHLAEKPIISGWVFQCHYKFTSMMLFLGSILLTASSLIGKVSKISHCAAP